MRKTLVIAATAAVLTAGGATAFAAVSHSGTDDTPRTSQSVPSPVAPTASIERHGGLDDGPNHDIGDDRGGDRGALNDRRGGLDDGPNHDIGDDRSVTTVVPKPTITRPTVGPSTYYQRGGSDDGPNHDINDDHGGDRGGSSGRHGGHDDGPNHDIGDDHGGRH